MKSKHVVIVITMVLILLVVLVACSQAEQQQEPQDLNAQQTTPATDVPTVEPTVEPAQTVEPVEADAQGEAGGTGEAGEVATPVKSGATEKEVLSNEELLELFQNVYDYYKGDTTSTEEEKIETELKMIENSAKIAYRKDLPADYIERYIDWRPIEGDPDDGLVDTGTNTDAGSGSTTDTGTGSGSTGGSGSGSTGSSGNQTLEGIGVPPPPGGWENLPEGGMVDASKVESPDHNYHPGVGIGGGSSSSIWDNMPEAPGDNDNPRKDDVGGWGDTSQGHYEEHNYHPGVGIVGG